jgi:hypothetical protein
MTLRDDKIQDEVDKDTLVKDNVTFKGIDLITQTFIMFMTKVMMMFLRSKKIYDKYLMNLCNGIWN